MKFVTHHAHAIAKSQTWTFASYHPQVASHPDLGELWTYIIELTACDGPTKFYLNPSTWKLIILNLSEILMGTILTKF